MSKLYLILSLTLIFYSSKAIDTLRVDEEITRQLELEFNEAAKNADAFIKWSLVGDWGKVNYSFNQGILENKSLTIKANEYKNFIDGDFGIVLKIKNPTKAKEGIYNLRMEVTEFSTELKDFNIEEFKLIIPEFVILKPPFNWLKFTIIILSLLIIFFIAYIYILYHKKFHSGSVLIEEPKEKANTYFLKGKSKFFFSDFYPCEVILKKGKDERPKIYYNNEAIIVNGEYAKKGQQLAIMDEVEIITNENEKIKFVYQ